MTPTQRTLAELRKRGAIAQVVERWIPQAKRRVDLFGCIDVIAIGQGMTPRPQQILGIQCCAGSSHAARRAKAIAEPRLIEWILAGGSFGVWSWSKRGPRGKRKTWQLREDYIGLHEFDRREDR